MYDRFLQLPDAGTKTFFLWGPRQTGKSTLLRLCYPDALWIDLRKSEELVRYTIRPELLRQELTADNTDPARQIVIDEIQKVPALLNEVHWLIENRGLHFTLCGSSARKVRRGAANLLGGRALRYELRGLTAGELGQDFRLNQILNQGFLPRIYGSRRARRRLDAYIADYLRQEIAEEGLVRSLPNFASFLDTVSLSDGEMVNYTNIGRECGVTNQTAKGYFGILEDTLLGQWLPAYRRRMKRRVISAPKFYLADVGVVNRLARRGEVTPGSELYGKAFENWVFHELTAYLSYQDMDAQLSYWRLPSGIEVDFILGDMQVAIEAKASARITRKHLKGLRTLFEEHPQVQKRLVVCLEPRMRQTDDGIAILPATSFVERLWQEELLQHGQ